MNPVSFMTAKYVARQVGYNMSGGWGMAQNSTMDYFRPLETYSARLGEVLDDVSRLGFDHLDLWLPHLHPEWATDEHLVAAQNALDERGLKVSSLAGGFGANLDEFERCCNVAQAVGTRILGGMTPLVRTERPGMVALMEKYDVVLAIENHPEKTPAEVLEQIGEGAGGRIGTCIDTGIWANQGYDPLKAIEELAPHILYVHLKDVLADSNETCRYGRGIVPLEACVRRLEGMGYAGGYSVEHEPHDYDPSEDVQVSAQMLRRWLAEICNGEVQS